MRKGEVWLINLDHTLGAEIQKTRPAVIVNEDAIGVLPLRVIVPLTSWQERYGLAAWMVRIDPTQANGLSKPSSADAFQIRSVAQQRFVSCIGRVSQQNLADILKAIRIITGG